MLIDLEASVRMLVGSIKVTRSQLGAADRDTITTRAKLVRRGNELRMVLPFNAYGPTQRKGDPALLKLLGQAFAAPTTWSIEKLRRSSSNMIIGIGNG